MTRHRGAALILLLAILSTLLLSLTLTGATLARAHAWRARQAEVRQARAHLNAARDPIRFWLNQRARRIVLPPHSSAPVVLVMDAPLPAQSSRLRIEAADLRALDAPFNHDPLPPPWLAQAHSRACGILLDLAGPSRRLNIATSPSSVLARALPPGVALTDIEHARARGQPPELTETSSDDWQLTNTSDLWAFRVEASCRRATAELVHVCELRGGAWRTLTTFVPSPVQTDSPLQSKGAP